MYLAYKYVAVVLMLAEVNCVAPRIGLPMRFPIMESDLHFALVAPPTVPNPDNLLRPNLLGRLDTDKYSFSFSHSGRLCFITKLHPWARMGMAERNDMLATQKSLMKENDAYKMATNWLDALSVDVKNLEKSSPLIIGHEFRWRNQIENGAKDYLPLFEVKWGKVSDPKVIIEIDGRNNNLLRLRLEEDAVSKRQGWCLPPGGRELLMAIPDAEFITFSANQRSNLVLRAISTNMAQPFGSNSSAGLPTSVSAQPKANLQSGKRLFVQPSQKN